MVLIISMQNKWSPYRIWDRNVYHGRASNLLRKLLGRNNAEGRLEKIYSLEVLSQILVDNQLEVCNVVYYDSNIWLSPLDRYFPELSVSTSRRIEALQISSLNMLGTGFILEAVRS